MSGTGPAVRQRHAQHFAALARGSETGLAGPEAAEWTARLAAATADLDQALQWSDDHGDVSLGLDMGAALWRWWLLRGRLSYGRAWLGKLLAQAGQRQDEPAGRAFCSAAVLAAENGDYGEAVRQARRALRILEPLRVPERTATAATVLGSAYRYLGDLPAARRSFATAMELRAGLGDRRALSAALNNMALLEVDGGDLIRARELFEQALAIKRQLGERQSLAIGLANLGDLLTRISQWDAAARALAEAAALAADLGHPQLIGTVQTNQGNVAAHQREWAAAASHYEAAVAAYQEAGHGHDAVEALTGLGRACYRLGRPDEGSRAPARRRGPGRGAGQPAASGRGPRGAGRDHRGRGGPAARRADRPAGRGAPAAGRRAEQQADRRRAVPEPGHRRAAPGHHLPQARPGRAGGSGPLRAGSRAGRHDVITRRGWIPGCYNGAVRGPPGGARATWLPGFGGPAPPRTPMRARPPRLPAEGIPHAGPADRHDDAGAVDLPRPGRECRRGGGRVLLDDRFHPDVHRDGRRRWAGRD